MRTKRLNSKGFRFDYHGLETNIEAKALCKRLYEFIIDIDKDQLDSENDIYKLTFKKKENFEKVCVVERYAPNDYATCPKINLLDLAYLYNHEQLNELIHKYAKEYRVDLKKYDCQMRRNVLQIIQNDLKKEEIDSSNPESVPQTALRAKDIISDDYKNLENWNQLDLLFSMIAMSGRVNILDEIKQNISIDCLTFCLKHANFHYLQLSVQYEEHAVASWLYKNTLEFLDAHETYLLQDKLNELFVIAGQNGDTKMGKWLCGLQSTNTSKINMLSHDSYKAFRKALEAGHEKFCEWLQSQLPSKTREILKNQQITAIAHQKPSGVSNSNEDNSDANAPLAPQPSGGSPQSSLLKWMAADDDAASAKDPEKPSPKDGAPSP